MEVFRIMSVTKAEFIEKLAKKSGIKKKEAKRQMELFIDTLVECLKEDSAVKFVGFGKFEVKTVKEIIGRNPKNGNVCMIPEHKKVKFYASEGLSKSME